MGVAPSGKIRRAIKPDIYPNAWLPAKTTVFNVQIVNAASLKAITGRDPPPSSINAAIYAKRGQPFFELNEEKSGIDGHFKGLKSIAQTDDAEEDEVETEVVQITEEQAEQAEQEVPKELSNPAGAFGRFRTWRDVEKDLEEANYADF
jgi:hypothetical protein